MDTYTVAVHWTNRRRHDDGSFVTFLANVQIEATDHHDAALGAAQMVHSVRCDLDGMVTATEVIDGPI